MNCSDDLVQLYAAGELQAVEAEILETHLATCDSCRRRVAFYKGLCWDLQQGGQPGPASEMDTAALADALRAEWLDGQEPRAVGVGTMATLWLSANPVVVGPAHAVGAAAGRAAGRALTGIGRRLLGRKGGGNR
ncbi:MAG: anti-sigma factor family protein [Mycobacterium leprae]